MQSRAALVFEDATFDFADVVVVLRVAGEVEGAAAGTGAQVVGAEDEAVDAGVYQCAGAHGAGFEGDVEGGVAQAVVGECLSRCAQGEDFSVGGGVVVGDGAVMRGSDDFAFDDDERADGDFAEDFGLRGLGDGEADVVFVVHTPVLSGFSCCQQVGQDAFDFCNSFGGTELGVGSGMVTMEVDAVEFVGKFVFAIVFLQGGECGFFVVWDVAGGGCAETRPGVLQFGCPAHGINAGKAVVIVVSVHVGGYGVGRHSTYAAVSTVVSGGCFVMGRCGATSGK